LTEKRIKKLKIAIKAVPNLEDWKRLIYQVPQNPWNTGENSTGWVANFDWLFANENYLKQLEAFSADKQNEIDFQEGRKK